MMLDGRNQLLVHLVMDMRVNDVMRQCIKQLLKLDCVPDADHGFADLTYCFAAGRDKRSVTRCWQPVRSNKGLGVIVRYLSARVYA